MLHRQLFVAALAALLFLFPPENARAAELTLSPVGTGTFQVMGNSLSGIGGFDVTITYDPGSHGSPQVTQGPLAAGSFFAANTNIPGQIRIALVHANGITGSGPLVTVRFGTSRGTTPPLLRVNSLIDTGGRSLLADGTPPPPPLPANETPSPGRFSALPETPSSPGVEPPEAGTSAPPPSPAPPGAVTASFPGTITLPGGGPPAGEQGAGKTPPAVPEPSPPEPRHLEPAEPPTPPEPVKREKRSFPPPPASVLERFLSWKGETTLANLAPLFQGRGGEWVKQAPAVGSSDGVTPVRLEIDPGWRGENPPSFALKGVSMKGFSTSGETGWVLELIPAAGATGASVTMEMDDASVEIPLVVVPPLPKEWEGKPLSDEMVNRFLKERGDGKTPAGDLTGDGKRDAVDDYVMIGSRIRTTIETQPPKPQTSREKSPSSR